VALITNNNGTNNYDVQKIKSKTDLSNTDKKLCTVHNTIRHVSKQGFLLQNEIL